MLVQLVMISALYNPGRSSHLPIPTLRFSCDELGPLFWTQFRIVYHRALPMMVLVTNQRDRTKASASSDGVIPYFSATSTCQGHTFAVFQGTSNGGQRCADARP